MKKMLMLLFSLIVVQMFAQINPFFENKNLLLANLNSTSINWETNNQTLPFFNVSEPINKGIDGNILQDKTRQPVTQANANLPCDCNSDMYFSANPGGFKVRCHETKFFELGTSVTLMPQNICNPAQCLGEWSIKVFNAQTGELIGSGSSSGNNTSFVTPSIFDPGFRIEFTGRCNGKVCKCEFFIKPKPGTTGSTCDCNTDMYVIANPGILKVRCNEKKYFSYGTVITLIPQNICNPADCLTQWSMRLYDSQTGALVPGGSGTGNSSSYSFTLNSVSGYRVEFTGSCNGKVCKCKFWIQTKAISSASNRAGVNGKKIVRV